MSCCIIARPRLLVMLRIHTRPKVYRDPIIDVWDTCDARDICTVWDTSGVTLESLLDK